MEQAYSTFTLPLNATLKPLKECRELTSSFLIGLQSTSPPQHLTVTLLFTTAHFTKNAMSTFQQKLTSHPKRQKIQFEEMEHVSDQTQIWQGCRNYQTANLKNEILRYNSNKICTRTI